MPRIAAKSAYIQLHRRPSLKSKVVRTLTVGIGAPIEFDESRYRTLSPAVFTAVREGSFLVRDLGQGDYLAWNQYYTDDALSYKKLAYKVGDSFLYLQYTAGLSCLVSWQDNTWEIQLCPQLYPASVARANGFTIASEPQIEWWIRVIDAKRNPLGWVFVDGKNAERVR